MKKGLVVIGILCANICFAQSTSKHIPIPPAHAPKPVQANAPIAPVVVAMPQAPTVQHSLPPKPVATQKPVLPITPSNKK